METVFHFAGSIEVGESVSDPMKYFWNNTANTYRLMRQCQHHGVHKFIFSSTAAVYGNPQQVPIPEDHPLRPINPYGSSKLAIEQALEHLAQTDPGFRYVSLRYFNAAGADPASRIGERHHPETHLIPIALQVASGRREKMQVFGTDYDTPDGTCIRDYIHVEDLASAHICALQYLEQGGESIALNCGYGRGYSVQEVINSVERVTGKKLNVEYADRRQGDPPVLVADAQRLHNNLQWKPKRDDLDTMIADAWRWERKLA